MTDTDHKFHRRLTDDELTRITSAVNEAGTPMQALAAAFEGFFDLALQEADGCDLADLRARRGTIKPADYAIPEDQWHAIGELLLRRGEQLSTALTTVNVLLDWMNVGPSSYPEDR